MLKKDKNKSFVFGVICLVLLVLNGCQKPQEISIQNFQIKEIGDSLIFRTLNSLGDSRLILKKETNKRIVLLNTSLISFFEVLNGSHSIVGLLEADRVDTSYIDVGHGNQINIEKIIKLNPDLIIGSKEQISFVENSALRNFSTLEVNNFLVNTPMKKMEVIKLIGSIIGDEEAAGKVYQKEFEKFNSLNFKSTFKTVFYLSGFNGVFFKSGCESNLNRLIKKSGSSPVCFQNQVKAQSLTSENTIMETLESDYILFLDWRKKIMTKKEQLPYFNSLESVLKGKKIIYCNTLKSGFYEFGQLEPSLMVQELNSVVKDSLFVGKYFSIIN